MIINNEGSRTHTSSRTTLRRFSILPAVLWLFVSGVTAQSTGSVPSDTSITTPVAASPDTTIVSDTTTSDSTTTGQIDSLEQDTTSITVIQSTNTDSVTDTLGTTPHLSPPPSGAANAGIPPGTLPPNTITSEDSTGVPDGWYFSAGIGWTIGNFELLSLWENAQPDSLRHLGITDTSFQILFDSSLQNTATMDTALLSFSIKETPAIYTMSFPVLFSLLSLRENRRLAVALSGSWMRKVFTGTIAATGDTLDRKVDLKESINVYTLLFSLQWGSTIPEQYFSIDGVDRSFFTIGLDIAPVVAARIKRTASSTSDHLRFKNLERALARSSVRFFHGGAAGLRLGLSMIKRLNARSATDFGVVYTIQGYGYFLDHGNRVSFNSVDPSAYTKDRPLFWVSNRLELSFSFLRRLR